MLAWHQENFTGIHEEYAHRTPLSPATVVAIQGYADDVEDSVALAFWTERARNEGRGARSWAQIVGMETVEKYFEDRDAGAALAAFEEYWPDAEGTGSQMLSWALSVATEWNRAPDLPATDRWIDRMLADGGSKFSAARRLASFPERRERALELARQGLERTARAGTEHADLVVHPGRPLGRTVSEYARTRARQWADRLVTYSELLSAAGEEDEALEALEEAAATAVDPAVFQRLADVKLSRETPPVRRVTTPLLRSILLRMWTKRTHWQRWSERMARARNGTPFLSQPKPECCLASSRTLFGGHLGPAASPTRTETVCSFRTSSRAGPLCSSSGRGLAAILSARFHKSCGFANSLSPAASRSSPSRRTTNPVPTWKSSSRPEA